MNICMFGAGRMAQSHAANIHRSNEAKLYCVVDPNEQSAKSLANKFDCKYFINPQDAFQDTQVDAFAIISTSDTHSDLIIECSKTKKPIFCEKPIDLNIDKIKTCVHALETSKTPFFLGFNRRFDPNFSLLHKRLRNEEVGNIEMISITSRDNPMPSLEYLRSSGGLFLDMTIHDFDMARWLLGEEITEVFATGSTLINKEISDFQDIDTAMLTLKTKTGKIVQINNSRRACYGYDQRVEVFGSKGMIIANNCHNNTLQIYNEKGAQLDRIKESFPERYQEAYRIEMKHFLKEVVRKQTPLITALDGLKATQIAYTANRSLKSGKSEEVSYWDSN